jgi:sugar/nucleoside kinase (ribokinase family)
LSTTELRVGVGADGECPEELPDFDVIAYGVLCLDTIWRATGIPQNGGFAAVLEEIKVAGGEAANTAMALSRWGVKVALAGSLIGEDDDGRQFLADLAERYPAIDQRFLVTSPEVRTLVSLCIATPDGQRAIFGRGFEQGRSAPLNPALFQSARLLTLDGSMGEEGLRACRLSAGLPIVAMDFYGHEEVNNRCAITQVSAESIDRNGSLEHLAAWADGLRSRHGPTTIVTCGPNGCLAALRGTSDVIHVPAYRAPAMADSTGAGDSFRAGLIYGSLERWDLLETLRFASAVGALNCGAMGAAGGICSIEAVREFQASAVRSGTEVRVAVKGQSH